MGDSIHLNGDFRGSIVNIKSELRNVQQAIGDIQSADADSKAELEKLIGQLSDALEKIPAGRKEEAEAVAATAKNLVEQAKTDKPNKTMLQITGEGLKAAAKNLADVTPTVLAIATQIVLAIAKIAGGR